MLDVLDEDTAGGIVAGFKGEILLITCHDQKDRDNWRIQWRSWQGQKRPGQNQGGRNGSKYAKSLKELTTLGQSNAVNTIESN
jgi:hypothetical protein